MSRDNIDLHAIRSYRLDRVRSELAARDYAAIVLYDPVNIRYATDTSNLQVWTLHNPGRYVFVPADGPVIMFESHGRAHLAEGFELINEVRSALSWYYFAAGPRWEEFAKRWAAEIADLVRIYGGGNTRLATDRLEPAGVAALTTLGIRVQNGQAVMEHARAIKSTEEIQAMQASMAVCEAGMQAVREATRPGITENEAWSLLHQTNIARGGEWIESRAFCSGHRTNPWFQESGDRVIEAGDIVTLDTDLIGPYGYCSDISRTWLCGEGKPDDGQRRLYATAYETIQRYIDLLKPGLSFREYAELCGDLPGAYAAQRYSCIAHGLGLCDEYPAVPYEQDFEAAGYDGHFEENMVICAEIYIGAPGESEGVRLEEQLLLTAEGTVLMSNYPFEQDFL